LRAIAFASSFLVIVERPLTPSLRARAKAWHTPPRDS